MNIPITLFCMCMIVYSTNGISRVVHTEYGKIRGYLNTSYHGQEYLAFEGIPFAKPPLGELRFQPPQPPRPWKGILSATQKRNHCYAYGYLPAFVQQDPVSGSEDCLYLNIYVPKRKSRFHQPFPVSVWFYGGAFQFGAAEDATEYFLMDRDIILVTLNYRLGPLGFLSTEDEVVPGNMGLKDQNAALRWINENIDYFGGNPNNVILTGVSAGGASVHYHYFSKMSKNLFHGGISVSGTVMMDWSQTEASLEKGKKVAALIGCPTDDTVDMVDCLRNVPAEDITRTIRTFIGWNWDPDTIFGPVVEYEGEGEKFLDAPPAELMATGKVHDLPWITSTVTDEGLWTTAYFMQNATKLQEMEENWEQVLPHFLDYNFTIPESEKASVAEKIRQEYFDSLPVSINTRDRVSEMQGDRNINIGAELAAKLQAAQKSPVWFYQYGYRARYSLTNLLTNTNEQLGVSHCDDVLQFIQYDSSMDPTTTESDRQNQATLLDLWETFAYTKRAVMRNVEWEPVEHEGPELKFLMIHGPDDYEMISDDNFGNKEFWNTIDFDENKY